MIRVCICSTIDDAVPQASNSADEPTGGEYVHIAPDNFFLALKDLEAVYGGGLLPAEWWAEVRRDRPGLLLQVGLENLMGLMEALEEADLIPPLPDDWRERFYGLLDTVEEIDESRFADLPAEEADRLRNDNWYKLGRLFMHNLDFERAVSFFQRSVKVNPRNHLAWRDIGFCLMRRGDYQSAAWSYFMATRTHDHDGEAWRGVGDAYFNMKNYKVAVAAYNQAIRFNDGDPSLYERRLVALDKLHRAK